MTMNSIRRMAASVLKCGESRVRILDAKEAEKALTKDDVRELIKKEFVIEIPEKGNSRGRARFKQERMRMGRRRGPGSQKGSKFAGTTAKDLWIRKTRSQRRMLKSLKMRVEREGFQKAYKLIKGNAFKTKKQLLTYLQEKNLFKK